MLRVQNLSYSRLELSAGLMYIADCAESFDLGVMFRHAPLPKHYNIFCDVLGVLFTHQPLMPCRVVMVCMLARSWMKWTWA